MKNIHCFCSKYQPVNISLVSKCQNWVSFFAWAIINVFSNRFVNKLSTLLSVQNCTTILQNNRVNDLNVCFCWFTITKMLRNVFIFHIRSIRYNHHNDNFHLSKSKLYDHLLAIIKSI